MPNNKHIICTINNDLLIEIPSHPYVLVNRSIFCSCGIEAENNFLLESLATCQDSKTKLIIYFTGNSAFTNYLSEFNLMDYLDIPILTNKSTSEVTLPVFLNKSTAKEVKAEEINEGNYNCECTAQFYIILALSIIIIGLVVFTILQVRRIKLCRE